MVTKAVQTVSLFICFFLYAEINFLTNIMINTFIMIDYFCSVTLHTKSKYFVSYRVNQQDPDDGSWEELSFFFMINPKPDKRKEKHWKSVNLIQDELFQGCS